MVAMKPDPLLDNRIPDDLFDAAPELPPKVPESPSMKNIVVNPMTCAMVDVGDTSSKGIDSMIECLMDIAEIESNLDATKKRIRAAIERLADKSDKNKRTHHIIGDRLRITLEYKGRKFNNAGLKKVYATFSDRVKAAVAAGDAEEAAAIAAFRDSYLRISEIEVQLTHFKLYEKADQCPAQHREMCDMIGKLEEEGGWPSFKLPERKEDEKLGCDPITVQRI